MRPIFIMVAAVIIACYPNTMRSQASINNNVSVSHYDPVPLDFVSSTGGTYSMNNFVNNEEYKIVVVKSGADLAQNLQMSVGLYTIGSDVQFTYHTYDQFGITYYLASGTLPGQLQTVKFQIYRKRFGLWDWQTTFFYDINSTCRQDYTLDATSGYPLYKQKYEVSGNLSVTNYAAPNGILMTLDGGQSVSLLPGFYTSLSNNGALQVIIDGCGGSYIVKENSGLHDASGVKGLVAVREIVLYPNPVTDKCHLSFPKNIEGQELEISVMDINGRILYSRTEVSAQSSEIDLSNFETGMYFIHVSGQDINYNQKVIKQ